MKPFIRILFFFFLVTQICFGQWFWQNPLPQGNTLNDVHFVDENTGWAVGYVGTIIHTTNAGVTWDFQISNITKALEDVEFINEIIGFAVGEDGVIVRTTNGGNNWINMNSGTTAWLKSVSIIDENNLCVVGSNVLMGGGTEIIKSTDGGASWNSQILNDVPFLDDIDFVDANNGLAVGGGVNTVGTPICIILKTSNGGINWSISLSGSQYPRFYSVRFYNLNNAWVSGSDGIILKSTNAGVDWTQQISGTNSGLSSITFKDLNNGIVLGYDGQNSKCLILRTTNGGINWIQQLTNISDGLSRLSYISPNFVWGIGPGMDVYGCTIVYSTDFGVTWNMQSSGITIGLNSVQFIDSNIGWVVGRVGTILKTTNGGINWIQQQSETTINLKKIFFLDTETGWVVGDSGLIIKTINGGVSWFLQQSSTSFRLNDVYFLDQNIGWSIGYNELGGNSIILKTTDGGINWIPQPEITDRVLNSIYFINHTKGWMVGGANGSPCFNDCSVIINTTDGGITWVQQGIDSIMGLQDVYFIDENNGWAAGKTILRTTNGGTSWFTQMELGGIINDIIFNDINNGWAVGVGVYQGVGHGMLYGLILKTTDGGENWLEQVNGSGNGLRSISFLDNNNGWAVGWGGTILHTSNGGVVPVELTSFTAQAENQKVILKWTTATELNNNGFEVQRKVAESEFATIGFVKGEGTTTNQKEYSYIDKDLIDGKYFYRLKQVDYNGSYEYSNVIEVDVRSLNEYALEQNFPNPFNPTTTIEYVLKEKTNAKLILLNAIGEEVAVLVNEEQDKGFHKVDFNASTFASGVYFYRLQAGDFVQTRKMILLK